MYEYFHEVKVIELRSSQFALASDLIPVFLRYGFTLYEDVLALDRGGVVPPWQNSSIVDVEVLCDDKEVFEFEEDEQWNTLRLKYLFASLPFECADQFIKVAYALNEQLGTSLSFQGRSIDREALKTRFEGYREEVLATTFEDVGSEGLAILILSTYPRH